MKSIWILTLLALLYFVAETTSLTCYDCCYYEDGRYGSSCPGDCLKDNPGVKYQYPCTAKSAKTRNRSFMALLKNLNSTTNEDAPKVEGEPMCAKYGRMINGKLYLSRECEVDPADSLIGRCFVSERDVPDDNGDIIAKGATDYFCNTDNCNGGPTINYCNGVASNECWFISTYFMLCLLGFRAIV